MACCAANPSGSYCNNWCPNTCVQQGKNGAPLYYDSNGNPVYAAATFGGPIGATAAASSPGATGPGQQASGPGGFIASPLAASLGLQGTGHQWLDYLDPVIWWAWLKKKFAGTFGGTYDSTKNWIYDNIVKPLADAAKAGVQEVETILTWVFIAAGILLFAKFSPIR